MYKFNEMLTAELEKLITEYTDKKRVGISILTDKEFNELSAELKTR